MRHQRRSGSSSVVLAKYGNGRNWLPVGRRLRSKGSLIRSSEAAVGGCVSANDAATFRACLKMQLWPKDRKALHGLAGHDDQLCDLCHECIDSLEHRNWECVHTVGFRAELIEKFPNRFESLMRMRNRLFLDLALVTGSFPVLPTHPEEQETWFPRKSRDWNVQHPAEPLRPWLWCAHCTMLILHCRLAAIARLWATLGREEVVMARRQNHR